MKKNSLKRALVNLAIMLFLMSSITSCRKDLYVGDDNLSGLSAEVARAAKWYNSQLLTSSKNSSFTSKNHPEWNQATVKNQKTNSTIIIPVYKEGAINRDLNINKFGDAPYNGTIKEYDRTSKSMTRVTTYSINGTFIEEGVLYPTGQYRLLRSASKEQSLTTLSLMGSEGGGGFPDEPTFPSTPTPGNSNQYSESEATMIIDQLSNPITGEGIELYLVANYRGSKELNLSVFSVAGNSVSAGSYSLTPHYTANGTLLFYAAFRNSTNGIEYIIKANYLQAFRNNISYYTYAANLVYAGGMPTKSQIMVMNGDYVDGLVSMWSSALRSIDYWGYLATLYITHAASQPKVIQKLKISIAPEYTFTQTVENHLADVVKKGANAGLASRPYMNSPLTIQEIMSTGAGTADLTYPGGLNWRVPGNFRGSNGFWELGLNPHTKVIYHFNFTN